MAKKPSRKINEKLPPRARTLRRQAERDAARATRKLAELATALPGGSPERPHEVPSAAVVEVRARAARCVICDGELELKAHEADPHAGEVLRRVDLACRACHAPRRLWFRIAPPLPS